MSLKEELLKNKKDLTRLTGIFHSWRAIRHTEKGKKAGCDERWSKYDNFRDDMIDGWFEKAVLCRKDKRAPFSKENCIWIKREDQGQHRLATLEYNGEVKTIREWSIQFKIPFNGMMLRYGKREKRNFTNEEIIFGRNIKNARKITSADEINEKQKRSKASKMMSSYRCADNKKGYKTDITKEWIIENIFTKTCVYCGDIKNVGCDRKNNNIGHTKENCVPSCFRCNMIKMNNFSFEEMKIIGKFVKTEIIDKR